MTKCLQDHKLHGVVTYIYAPYAGVRIYTNKKCCQKNLKVVYICRKGAECPLTTYLYVICIKYIHDSVLRITSGILKLD